MDDSKSIEELENNYWETYDFPTTLVENCFKYRKIPINLLSIEQIRALLTQNIGVTYLFKKAYQILTKDILAEGDFYPGDLLKSVLNIKEPFFENNPEFRMQLLELLKEKRDEIQGKNESNVHRQLLRSIDGFLNKF